MPIPSGPQAVACAAATASAGSPATRSRFGFGPISAMTVSFTVIGCEAPEVVHRGAVGGGAGFLLLGRRRLEGVPVGQVRRGQPLDLVGGGDLQHAEDAQHIRAQVVARSRLVLLARARHQARPPAVRDRPPAVEGTGPPDPMISPTTDNQLKGKGREEGRDDPARARKAVVTRGNTGCVAAGHGSGFGSGNASAGGRASPGLAQEPTRRARPGRVGKRVRCAPRSASSRGTDASGSPGRMGGRYCLARSTSSGGASAATTSLTCHDGRCAWQRLLFLLSGQASSAAVSAVV